MANGLRFLVVLLATGALSTAWADGVYRWVDDQGVVNYGTEAPRAGVKPSSVREVDAAPAIVSHDARDAAQERRELAQRLAQAEESRLRRELLEAQIDAENAKAALLRAQSQAASAAAPCGPAYDCDGLPLVVVSGYARRYPHDRQTPHPVHAAAATPVVVHPVGTPYH